jgi:hypothetical protein
LRIVFFSLSYPTPWQPTAAAFNRCMVEALRMTHAVEVVAPVPWTERFHVARGERQGLHPLYLFPPKVLREHYGTFLWLSARRTLRRLTTIRPDAFSATRRIRTERSRFGGAEADRPGRDRGRIGRDGARGRTHGETHSARAAEHASILTMGRTLRERAVGSGHCGGAAFTRASTAMFTPGDGP